MDPYAVKDPKVKMLSSCIHVPWGGVHACMLSPSQPALSSGLYRKYLQAQPKESSSGREDACMHAYFGQAVNMSCKPPSRAWYSFCDLMNQKSRPL